MRSNRKVSPSLSQAMMTALNPSVSSTFRASRSLTPAFTRLGTTGDCRFRCRYTWWQPQAGTRQQRRGPSGGVSQWLTLPDACQMGPGAA